MSLFSLHFDILSDLHLETPLVRPRYTSFNLDARGNSILLLGDIGLVKDEGLFVFLRRSLEQTRGLQIIYILGNHEAYQITLESAVQKLRAFENEAKSEYGGRFKFLFRDRYDLDEKVTILGCTLWSAIQPHQSTEVLSRLTDFNEERGIRGWSLRRSVEEHDKDLKWLNTQVLSIQNGAPHRQIIIATHHCPTTDPRAANPAHRDSSVGSAFISDLSKETCWVSPAVKLWAFGHTHYSCNFRDEETGKLVVSNQQGYMGMGQAKRNPQSLSVKIVGEKEHQWQIIETAHSTKRKTGTLPTTQSPGIQESIRKEKQPRRDQQTRKPLFQRATKRVQAFLRLAPGPTK
ncbi:uncharacterized protein K460DRAFT_329666 [Cucurbitaria berberidis CBS 394.84]|uniref:Calcineurin-like phosphoesterase domain-containing protein n=1 Tax=Cucurbitaria berberidis CBS 394.84 TaxID=1168544 RepID=A0A9P4L9C0_9PLEO|nr:uncharacterized protein K460DRAFT_329666 [Cucurbitaria berberidis CBS 394.84]KAF1846890.1 hypothetical protein K460DRAFT_329666 [Cucurbitaria berberidis CBS 394.84]